MPANNSGIKIVEKKIPIGEKKKLILVQTQMMATTIKISADQNIKEEFLSRSSKLSTPHSFLCVKPLYHRVLGQAVEIRISGVTDRPISLASDP